MAKGYEGKETEFNGAMLQALRLDKELQITSDYFSTYHKDYNPAMVRILQSHIFNLDDEISPKMNKAEKEKRKLIIMKINEVKGIAKRKKNSEDEVFIDVNIQQYEKKIHRLRAFRRFLIEVGDRAQMFNPNKQTGARGGKGF